MKRLDKFSLLIENEEMGKEVKRIADKAGINKAEFDFCRKREFYNFKSGKFTGWSPNANSGDVITFDQFKAMFEPKIIGYKCPMDLWGGKVKNSTVYSRMADRWYGDPLNGSACFWLPTEIVETWEPIYEEVNTELDNLKSEAEKLKTQLDSVMKAIEEKYNSK